MECRVLLNFHFYMFKWFGVLPPEDASFLYHIWSVISLAVIGIGLPLSQFITLIYTPSVFGAIKMPVLMCTTASICIKCVLIYINRKKVDQLIETMYDLDKRIDAKAHDIFEKPFKTSQLVRKAFSTMYWSSYVVLFLELIFFGNENSFWQSSALWPWPWSKHPIVYYVILLLQMTTNFVNCAMAAATDSFGTILSIIITAHLKLLGTNLKKLRHIKFDDAIDYRNELLDAVAYHDACLKYSQLLDSMLSSMLFLQFGGSIPVLCTCAYQLSQASKISIMELAFIAFYMPGMFTQLFVPCYFGTSTAYQSNRLTVDLFESNWIEADKSYKKLFLMTMVKLTSSFAIFAGRFIPLNLNTFIVILKTTYSFYAMLANTQPD